MTDEEFEEFLAHFGVKGMKWGVRRFQDWRFKRNSQSLRVTFKIAHRADKAYNAKDLDRINNKSAYKNQDFKTPSALRTKYYKEHQDAYAKRLEEAAQSLGTNKSGTKRYTILMNDDGDWDVALQDVKHADEESFSVSVSYDDAGYILSVEAVDGEMAQSFETAEYLAQFGVKGMHWGVRKALSTSDDSKVAGSVKNQAKVGGVTSLSNEQISIAIKRMNLENEYKKSISDTSLKQKGLKLVGKILLDFGTAYVSSFIKHPGANAATGGNFAWAYAGAKTIDGIVINNKQKELGN